MNEAETALAPLTEAAGRLLADLGASFPPVETQTVAAIRERAVLASVVAPHALRSRVTDHALAWTSHSFRVRVYRPARATGVVLYFHGGGWVTGSLDASNRTCDRLATDLAAVVVSVEYPLAPEHRFPAAVECGYVALEWTADHVVAPASTLTVAGDSAGGNVAAAVTLMARDRGGPHLDRQMLMYPVVRCHTRAGDLPRDRGTPLLTAEALAWYGRQYLARPDDEPAASPLLAERLDRLAPATIATVGHDPLTPDVAAYVERLRAAGVPVRHVHHARGFHGYYSFGEVLPEARQAWLEVVTAHRSA